MKNNLLPLHVFVHSFPFINISVSVEKQMEGVRMFRLLLESCFRSELLCQSFMKSSICTYLCPISLFLFNFFNFLLALSTSANSSPSLLLLSGGIYSAGSYLRASRWALGGLSHEINSCPPPALRDPFAASVPG